MSIYSDSGPFSVVPEWVIDAGVSDRALRLYVVLGRYADRGGHCNPRRALLAQRMGCSADAIDRAKRELRNVGALDWQQRSSNGALGANDYTLFLVAPERRGVAANPGVAAVARLGSRDDAARGSRGGAAVKENQIERDPPMGEPPPADAVADLPDARDALEDQGPGQGQLLGQGPEHSAGGPAGRIVAGYVADYRAVCGDHDPPRSWRSAAGRSINVALRDGETERDIQGCLGVIAKEGKHPSNLQHVLSDMHADRPRRNR